MWIVDLMEAYLKLSKEYPSIPPVNKISANSNIL